MQTAASIYTHKNKQRRSIFTQKIQTFLEEGMKTDRRISFGSRMVLPKLTKKS